MGKFEDKKKEIFKAGEPKVKGQKRKYTFNEQQFNELGTALLNDADYKDTVMVTKNGELVESTSTPIVDLRKGLIAGPLKAAGVDSAEVTKIAAEHQFSNLPLYPFVSTLIEGYMDAGKTFAFERRKDMTASLKMVSEDEITKTSRTPGKDNATTTSVYGAHRRVKSNSKCPANLKRKVK